MRKKTAILFCAALMAVCMVSVPAFADFSDTDGHWAQAPIDRWAGYSVLNGYSDGSFAPDGLITRGELFKVLDSVFSYQKDGANAFSDLSESDWYYSHVLRLVGAGVLNGSDGRVNANDNITREQAFALLARVFEVAPGERGLNSFSDADSVSGWARAEVGGLAAKGYVQGSGGALNPGGNLTRAEAVQVLDNIVKGFYSVAGAYSADIDGAALVNVSGVELEDSSISGDLYVTQGLKAGDFTLSGSTLSGTLFVRGGGPSSIRILGSVVGSVSIRTDEVTGPVRILSDAASSVGAVSIADGSAGTILEGSFEEVVVGADTVLRIGEAEIGKITVEGEGTTVNVDEGATVRNIEIDAPGVQIAVDGEVEAISVNAADAVITAGETGKISEVTVNSGSVEIAGTGEVAEVTVKAGAEAVVDTVGTKVVRETPSSTGTTAGSTGSTGSSGGGGSDPGPSDTTAQDYADLAYAKALVEATSYTADQADAGTLAAANTKAGQLIAALNLGGLYGVSATVEDAHFTTPTAGTTANPSGTDGLYKFTVRLSKNGLSDVTGELSMLIVATPIVATPAVEQVTNATITGDILQFNVPVSEINIQSYTVTLTTSGATYTINQPIGPSSPSIDLTTAGGIRGGEYTVSIVSVAASGSSSADSAPVVVPGTWLYLEKLVLLETDVIMTGTTPNIIQITVGSVAEISGYKVTLTTTTSLIDIDLNISRVNSPFTTANVVELAVTATGGTFIEGYYTITVTAIGNTALYYKDSDPVILASKPLYA